VHPLHCESRTYIETWLVVEAAGRSFFPHEHTEMPEMDETEKHEHNADNIEELEPLDGKTTRGTEDVVEN
jgi:hypothetical protein